MAKLIGRLFLSYFFISPRPFLHIKQLEKEKKLISYRRLFLLISKVYIYTYILYTCSLVTLNKTINMAEKFDVSMSFCTNLICCVFCMLVFFNVFFSG